jgi:hypothetical protein
MAAFLRVRGPIYMPQFPELEGSLSHLRIEELASGGQMQERSLSGHLRTWIAFARLAANRAVTAIPLRVNCVVRPRSLEPLLCGKIQTVGRMQKRGKLVEL